MGYAATIWPLYKGHGLAASEPGVLVHPKLLKKGLKTSGGALTSRTLRAPFVFRFQLVCFISREAQLETQACSGDFIIFAGGHWARSTSIPINYRL